MVFFDKRENSKHTKIYMPNKSPKVFVIILNYNGALTLNDCLNSVFQSDYNNFEVVVVDNDSNDNSFESARQKFSRAHFIKNSVNVGFAQGNNVGIRFALEKFADMVFLLNNDTVIEKDTFNKLVHAAIKNPRAGIFSPLILNPDKSTIWFAGGKILWNKMKTIHLLEKETENPYSSQYLSGCSMLIKNDVFKKIGLFDERYFLYYEDADISLRAKRAGFDLLMIPSTSIIHLEQSNKKNDSKIYWLVLSGLIFFFTHSSWQLKILLYPYVLLRKTKNLLDVIFRKTKISLEIRRAFRDYSAAKKFH